jgi:hypothetical protein
MSKKERVELYFEDLIEKLDVRDIIEDCMFQEHHDKIKQVLLAMYL